MSAREGDADECGSSARDELFDAQCREYTKIVSDRGRSLLELEQQ
jgi:hypothetical protein